MMIIPGTAETRQIVNARLVAARQACQTLYDELEWLDRHFKDPLNPGRVPAGYMALHDTIRDIENAIVDLWKMSNDDMKSQYKHFVGRRVLD